MANIADLPATEMAWLVPHWLPMGEGVVLGGHGGSGKSLVMAMLAVCTAAGAPFYGMATKQGAVLIYSCEDSIDEWRFRLLCAAQYLKLDYAQLPITVVDMRDFDAEPALFAPPLTEKWGASDITPRGYWLSDYVKEQHPVLVVLDSATDCFCGDENKRRDVRRYLRRSQRLLGFEACVIHILHIDKAASRSRTQTDLYSGATDWNNGVRARLALYRPSRGDEDDDASTDEPMRLEVQKINHGKPGAYIDLVYSESHRVFTKVAESMRGSPLTRTAEQEIERNLLRVLIAAEDAGDPFVSSERSSRNAHWRLQAEKALPNDFKGAKGKRELFLMLQRLKGQGLLQEEAGWNKSWNKTLRWRVTAKGREYAVPYSSAE